jgi:microcystin-dependent protein
LSDKESAVPRLQLPFFSPRFRSPAAVALLTVAAQLSTLRADNATGTTGGSLPVDNRQPTLVTRYIIALYGIFPNDAQETPTQQQGPNRSDPFLGEIKAVPFNYAPQGWAFCEGQLLSINQNQALFALLGTTYGGNGQTHFALPDLRGRTTIGAGQGPGLPDYALGQVVGSASRVLTLRNLPIHEHTLPGGGRTQFTGSGAPIDNRQPALALHFLVAADSQIMIVPWPQQPTGWTHCDGRLLTKAGHTFLFNHLANTYGGDGVTNFALPDLRGCVVLGDDGTMNGWSLGRKHGANETVLAPSDIKAHTHTTSAGATGPSGGIGNSASNHQPSLVLRWIVSYEGVFLSPSSGISFPCVGEMRLIAGNFPNGLVAGNWTVANGAEHLIDDHEVLFQVIGTSYGGDGQTNFRVPDLRARVDMGVTSGVTVGSVVGRETMGISLSEIPAHAHLVDLRIQAVERVANGAAKLTLGGAPGSSAALEMSNDLLTWTSLTTVQFTTASETFTDPNTSQEATRFYRARP